MGDEMTHYQRRIHYPNGYGASIICNKMSYGNSVKLFEVAVLYGDEITYDTPIGSDVIGYLDFHDVAKLLDEIKALPATPPQPRPSVDE